MTNSAASLSRTAAFFDVDGTLAQTTIVHYYEYFKTHKMNVVAKAIWRFAYLFKCVYYLIIDKIDRSNFNTIFYRSYRGLQADEIREMAKSCFHDVLHAKIFDEGSQCVASHKSAGREVVLVTGSIDFIVQPLAEKLGVEHLIAPGLVVAEGQFTGELDGPPVGGDEKVRRITSFAQENDIDLAQSYAYGDSYADLPMLEAVGKPHAVNPDRKLAAVCKARGWPTIQWHVKAREEPLV